MNLKISKKINVIIIVILICILGFIHYKIKKRPTKEEKERMHSFVHQPRKKLMELADDFEIELSTGEKFILADNIGVKPIIINFFATWCEPCIMEMPEFNQFYQKYKNDIILIGINSGEEKNLVDNFILKNNVLFPVGIDKNRKIQRKYGVGSYPTTILIGVDGKIHLYEIGAISNTDITFEPILNQQKLIKERFLNITKEQYLEQLNNKPKIKEKTSENRESIILNERATELAKKIHCPSCGEIIFDSNCGYAKSLKKKLSKIDTADKTDEQILKELLLSSDDK